MQRTIILLLSFFVLACSVAHYQAVKKAQAEELIQAAYNGDLIAVKNAIEAGAPTDQTFVMNDEARHYQNAPLSLPHAAASGGNEKILQYLVKNNIDIHTINNRNWTPLFVAVRDGHSEFAAQLIENGADINAQTDTGTTPLMMVFLADFPDGRHRFSLLEYMLKKGADVNLQTRLNTDALFYAVTELQDQKAVQFLLDYQSDICRLYDGKEIFALAQDKKIRSLLKGAHKKQCKN